MRKQKCEVCGKETEVDNINSIPICLECWKEPAREFEL